MSHDSDINEHGARKMPKDAKKKKVFRTYSQQVDYLIDEKGLQVNDRPGAIETLKEVSYFALISGYKEPFRDPETKSYREGVQFRDIRALYDFDMRLSSIIFRHLLSVERHLQSLYGYHFVRLYGDSESAYLSLKSYDLSTPSRRDEAGELTYVLKNIARMEKTDQEYLAYYRENYSDVPLWIIMHSVTFGQLERLYFCAKPELRDVICSEFPSLKARNLSRILPLLVKVRNVCAHRAPLYNVRMRSFIPPMGVHRSLGLLDEEGKATSGARDLFAALVGMRYLMDAEEFEDMTDEIQDALNTLLKTSEWMTEDRMLPLMGFPGNWKDLAKADL